MQEQISTYLKDKFGDKIVREETYRNQFSVYVTAPALREVALSLKNDSSLAFDFYPPFGTALRLVFSVPSELHYKELASLVEVCRGRLVENANGTTCYSLGISTWLPVPFPTRIRILVQKFHPPPLGFPLPNPTPPRRYPRPQPWQHNLVSQRSCILPLTSPLFTAIAGELVRLPTGLSLSVA